jgi:hypothetical protein
LAVQEQDVANVHLAQDVPGDELLGGRRGP